MQSANFLDSFSLLCENTGPENRENVYLLSETIAKNINNSMFLDEVSSIALSVFNEEFMMLVVSPFIESVFSVIATADDSRKGTLTRLFKDFASQKGKEGTLISQFNSSMNRTSKTIPDNKTIPNTTQNNNLSISTMISTKEEEEAINSKLGTIIRFYFFFIQNDFKNLIKNESLKDNLIYFFSEVQKLSNESTSVEKFKTSLIPLLEKLIAKGTAFDNIIETTANAYTFYAGSQDPKKAEILKHIIQRFKTDPAVPFVNSEKLDEIQKIIDETFSEKKRGRAEDDIERKPKQVKTSDGKAEQTEKK